jgi:hypothetical protein
MYGGLLKQPDNQKPANGLADHREMMQNGSGQDFIIEKGWFVGCRYDRFNLAGRPAGCPSGTKVHAA